MIVLLLCLLPFFLMRLKNNKKQKEVVQLLTDFAKKKHCTLGKSEFWNQSIIGIDTSGKLLFFSKKADDNHSYIMINLAEVQKCDLVINKNRANLIDKLELKFDFFDNMKSAVKLEFYNNNQLTPLLNELETLKKWHAIANENL